jgi:hypothetical protein
MDEKTQKSRLAEFWNILNGRIEFDSLDAKFSALTHYLMNYLCLSVAEQSYRIIELEIYYYDKNEHPDPYVHCSKEQLLAGKWYFNGAGLDITFGNQKKGVYGGILIRGVKKMDKKEQFISGPSNVLKEIFLSIGDVVNSESSIYLRGLEQGIVWDNEIEPVKSIRIGLTKKKSDVEDYANKYYRYLVEMNIEHKFKDKEKVIRHLLSEKKLSEKEAKEMIGYNISLK